MLPHPPIRQGKMGKFINMVQIHVFWPTRVYTLIICLYCMLENESAFRFEQYWLVQMSCLVESYHSATSGKIGKLYIPWTSQPNKPGLQWAMPCQYANVQWMWVRFPLKMYRSFIERKYPSLLTGGWRFYLVVK